MNLYEIEDTSGWLGCPTPLETCRHQLRMYENEFAELNLQLREARGKIFTLVEMHAEVANERDSLRMQLAAAQTETAEANRRTNDIEIKSNWELMAKVPPALEACKILMGLVLSHAPRKIKVHMNRHESRMESVTPLLSPTTQARKKIINHWYVPTSWNTKWAAIQKRSEIRLRRPYQTRHTYACWCLTARGNLAFIAKQMGHKDFTMLVDVYAKWMDDESPTELQHIWSNIEARK